MNLPNLAIAVHKAMHKWWHDEHGRPIERNRQNLLALVISELAEALEGERKNLMDDHLPCRKMAEVEMADAFIRLLDFAEGFGQGGYLTELKMFDPLPSDKGEAIFEIMRFCMNIDGSMTAAWVNLAIARIRLYCRVHGYDLIGAFNDKMAYNAKREDHSHEERAKAHGKKW